MDKKIQNFQFYVIAILACASLPIAVFGGLALAFICAGASFISLLSTPYLNLKILLAQGNKIISVAFILLLLWAAFSLQWTLNEKAAFSVWIRVALLVIFAGFLLVFSNQNIAPEKKRAFGRWVTYSFIIALSLAFFEYITDGLIIRTIEAYILGNKDYIPKISKMTRGACYISLMFWAVAAYLAGRRGKLLILGILTLIVLSRLVSLSAIMGFIIGSLTFIFVSRYGRRKFDLPLIGVITFTIVIFPVIHLFTNPAAIGEMHLLPLSSLHRLYIWQFSIGKIMEKPLLGWGFDSSPFIPGGNDFIIGRAQDYWKYLPLHTHNQIIQLWLELGIAGPLLLAAIFSGLFSAIRKSAFPIPVKAALAALVMDYFTIGMTGFGVWQFWWLGAGFLSAAILLLAAEKDKI